MNEVILNKKIAIERCISQVRAYYSMSADVRFESDHLRQDAIAMNLQRIAESAIDIANSLIKSKKLGLPQDSADAFTLLHRANLISAEMLKNMKGMVGFRNVMLHQYQQLDVRIMQDVIEHHLLEPLDFANLALQQMD